MKWISVKKKLPPVAGHIDDWEGVLIWVGYYVLGYFDGKGFFDMECVKYWPLAVVTHWAKIEPPT